MKNIVFAVVLCMAGFTAFAQDATIPLKEATNLERQLKDADALGKYKEVLTITPNSLAVLVKCVEIDCNLGDRGSDNDKHVYYAEAHSYAQQAYAVDSNSADANYAMSLSEDKLLGIEKDNKKIIALQKDVKMYSDKALAANPQHGRANYIQGKWNYDIVTLPAFKLAATKTFHRGFSDVDIDSAIFYMEKCRAIEQYFAPNYLLLAKAYKFKKRPAQAVDVLGKLVKLPTRTPNDVAIKAEGQQLLSEMQ